MPDYTEAARCRDCAHYDLKTVLSANGRVLSNRAARCLWSSLEAWPVSVTRGLGRMRPTPGYMEPNEGAGCPCFRPLQSISPS